MTPPASAETGDRIELIVPGGQTHLGVARTVVGRAAMLAGFTFDGIEDLALGVHESMALLLSARPQQVRMTVWDEDGSLMVEMRMEPTERQWPPENLTDEVTWDLLEALADRVWLLEGGAGIGLAQGRR